MNSTLKIWNSLGKSTLGKWIFSRLICFKAPYFSSIRPLFRTLEPGRCTVSIRKRRAVHNHIGTVHAIAMCNMAELAGGMMTEVSIPKGARWIPAGMTVQYLKKAKTDLVAVADGALVDWTVTGDVLVPVTVSDTSGATVFRAEIRMNIRQATKV